MSRLKAQELIEKYKNNTLTDEERALLEIFYLELTRSKDQNVPADELEDDLAEIWEKISEVTQQDERTAKVVPIRRMRIGYAVAAAVTGTLIVVGVGLWWNHKREIGKQEIVFKQDIKPGGNKAFLTLVDGQKISLTDAKVGEVVKQAGLQITKTKDGMLVYTINGSVSASGNQAAEQFNTVETPKGGQYQVVLPDGSQVWLNAASNLKYPVAFKGKERKVMLSGEAYFEVAHNKAMPFRVESAGQEVEVLGTHFDINAYPDEPLVKTTLLEGSVRLRRLTSDNSATVANASVVLRPGQQASIKNGSGQGSISVKEVDTDEVVAWKNGYFMFVNEPLESIMRKIGRWYNADVEFKDEKLKQKTFSGPISRMDNVSKVLRRLELTHEVQFSIINGKIIVSSFTPD